MKRTEVEERVGVAYTCAACDLVQDAEVDTWGMSAGVFGSFGDRAEAAHLDAAERAQDTLMFVPCPRCGERAIERSEVVWKTATRYAAIAFFTPILTAAVMWLRGAEEEAVLWVSGGVGAFAILISAGALLFSSRNPWHRAAERTHFVGEAETLTDEQRPNEQRREEQAEQAAMQRKVLYSLAFAIAFGVVAAFVQLIAQGGFAEVTSRAPAVRPTSAAPPTAPVPRAPRQPSDQQLRYPLRHQLHIGKHRINVFEGYIRLAGGIGEQILVPGLWSYQNDRIAIVYNPALTAVTRADDTVILYGNAGSARIQFFAGGTKPGEIHDALDELEESLNDNDADDVATDDAQFEKVTATIGHQARNGRRRRGAHGDTIDRFVIRLDQLHPCAVIVRRTSPSSPLLDRALETLTSNLRAHRPRYLAIRGDDEELYLDKPVELQGISATLRQRETYLRLIDGWRIEHPADVVVMRRQHARQGQAIIFERAQVELVVARRPAVPSPQQALAWLTEARAAAEAGEAAKHEVRVGEKKLPALRSQQHGKRIIAFGAKTAAGGGLAVLLIHHPEHQTAAQSMLDEVLPLILR